MITEELIGAIFLYIVAMIFIGLMIHFDKKLGGFLMILASFGLMGLPSIVSGIGNYIYVPVLLFIAVGIYITLYGFANGE